MRRVVVPDAGHNIHAERPQAFLSHLVDFVSRH
jgi:pimeloyl-ACP methyl ester carboxylesterase